MKGKMKNQQSKRYNKRSGNGSAKFTCFGYGKQGHIKVDCTSLVINKKRAQEKKNSKLGKSRRAYIS